MLSTSSSKKITTSMSTMSKNLLVIADNYMSGAYGDDLDKPLEAVITAQKNCEKAMSLISSKIAGQEGLKLALAASDAVDPIIESILQVNTTAKFLQLAMEGDQNVISEDESEEDEDEDISDEIEETDFSEEESEEEKTEDEEVVTDSEDDEEEEIVTDEIEDFDDIEEDSQDDEEDEETKSCTKSTKINATKIKKQTLNKSTANNNASLSGLWSF